MVTNIVPVPVGEPTFAGVPRCDELAALDADVAVIGIGGGYSYAGDGGPSPSDAARQAVRAESMRFAPFLSHYDFDFQGPVLGEPPLRIVDCGDVAMTPGDDAGNSAAATAVIAAILARGAVPVVLGGDDSVPIPVLRGYREHFPDAGGLCVVQIDAHLDWRDERDGIREGLSSPMRRASELPWVQGMAQIGLRGAGSARAAEFAAARAFGSVLIGAAEVHERGIAAALARVPEAAAYYIAFDIDALDPAFAPGVLAEAFGGLSYDEASNLLRGVARKGSVVGYNVVEIVPSRDLNGMTSRVAGRLTLNLLGEMARRQFATGTAARHLDAE